MSEMRKLSDLDANDILSRGDISAPERMLLLKESYVELCKEKEE